MSNYTKTTDFEAKDSLPTGDSGKIIRGAEFETEFDAISTAIATKADTAGPTFTGTLTFETISDGTIGVTAFVDEDDMSSDSATLVPTQQSVKAYVDSQVTAQDLDFQADSGGALSIDLDSETLTFTGGTGVDTSGSGNAVTFAIDSTVATLTGSQTLTNKTLTSPDVNTPDIDGGTIDGTVIGGTTPAAVSATTVSATGNITVDGTVDGRDVATDGTKLDGIESGATADQTAAEIRTLVESATDSNVFTDADHTKLDGIEAGATGDQTNAEIRAAVEAATDSNVFTDADHSKLDGIEAGADVTDTTNVTAAGALMDSELTNITAVKSLDQGVATTDTPTFAGLATSANVTFGDNDKAIFGAGSDLQIYHSGSQSFVQENGTGQLVLDTQNGARVKLTSNNGTENMVVANKDGDVELYYDNAQKLATTSTGIDVTGVITTDGMTTSGNVDFGDSDIARFGAGNDLQIYHDGANSYIEDAGTGSLFIRGTSLILEDAGGNDYIAMTDTGTGGTVEIKHNAATKLTTTSTGVDVTGTVTADDAVYVEGSSPRLQLQDTDGTVQLSFIQQSGEDTILRLRNNTADGGFTIAGYGGASTTNRFYINPTGDISFYEDTGTTAKLFWDASAESLGIGTSSPDTMLHLSDTLGGAVLRLERNDTAIVATDQYGAIEFEGQDANAGASGVRASMRAVAEASVGQTSLTFSTAGSGASEAERMRIDSSGNVGIGTDSPTAVLTSVNSGALTLDSNDGNHTGFGLLIEPSTITANTVNSAIGFARSGGRKYAAIGMQTYADADQNGLNFYVQSTASGSSAELTEAMRIDSAGNVGIGTSSPSAKLGINASAPDFTMLQSDVVKFRSGVSGTTNGGVTGSASGDYFARTSGGKMMFSTNDGVTAHAVIDSSGNVGIGTSSPSAQLHALSTMQVGAGTNFGNRFTIYDSLASGTTPFVIRDSANGDDIFTISANSTSGEVKLDAADDQGVGYFAFATNASERMRIDSSGHLLVGTTDSGIYDDATDEAGHNLLANGQYYNSAVSEINMILNKQNSDGDILQFRKDGSTVGSIGVDNSDNLTIEGNSTHGGLQFATNVILPHKNGALADNTIGFGNGANRFTELFLSGGVYLGGTGSANKLDDYEEGTFTPVIQGATTAGTFTYGTQSGLYTKIGNVVSVHIAINVSATSVSPVGAITVQGLPFSTSGSFQSLAIGWVSGITFSDQLNAYAPNSETFVVLRNSVSGGNGNQTAGSNLSSSFWLFISGTYRAT